jgi:hypothetical protein
MGDLAHRWNDWPEKFASQVGPVPTLVDVLLNMASLSYVNIGRVDSDAEMFSSVESMNVYLERNPFLRDGGRPLAFDRKDEEEMGDDEKPVPEIQNHESSREVSHFVSQRDQVLNLAVTRLRALMAIEFMDRIEQAGDDALTFLDRPIRERIPPTVRTLELLPKRWQKLSKVCQVLEPWQEAHLKRVAFFPGEDPPPEMLPAGSVSDLLLRVVESQTCPDAKLGKRFLTRKVVEGLVKRNPNLSDPRSEIGLLALAKDSFDRDGDLLEDVTTTSLVVALKNRTLSEKLRVELIDSLLLQITSESFEV